MTSYRILVVDDHPLVAFGLGFALAARGWHVESTTGPSALDAIDAARRSSPDCVLLDLELGDSMGSGLDLIAPMRALGAEVVMLTAERSRSALAGCIEAGAAGWIGKESGVDEIAETIQHLLDGNPLVGRTAHAMLLDELRRERAVAKSALIPFEQLSRRERAVLGALVEGLTAEEIASRNFVSLATVRSQIHSLLGKLGVRSQLAAVALANRAGWRHDNTQITA